MWADRRLWIAVLASVALVVGAVISVFSLKPQAGLLSPDDRRVVTQGAEIYTQSCASCHGENLEGQVENWQSPGADGLMPAPPHDETGHTWHHGDALLFEITKFGVAAAANHTDYQSAMPAYEGVLSDEEIIAVLSFIKSTWPEDIQTGHDVLNRQIVNQ